MSEAIQALLRTGLAEMFDRYALDVVVLHFAGLLASLLAEVLVLFVVRIRTAARGGGGCVEVVVHRRSAGLVT